MLAGCVLALRCVARLLALPLPSLPRPHASAGLPAAVTLGKVTAGPSNATIRFTHKPWYSQGLQVRVRVWNPIGADGKLLAAGKEVEETLPAPKNATAGVIPAGAGNLARVVSGCALNTRFPTNSGSTVHCALEGELDRLGACCAACV